MAGCDGSDGVVVLAFQRGHHLELDPTARENVRTLKAIDFELAYLAVLTLTGLKPMSRWERPLDKPGQMALKRLGLHVRRVRRTVRRGKAFDETIFAAAPAYLDIYWTHFADLPVDKSAETVRLEGFLFGYPPCCTTQYVKQHYAPNEFPTHKQETLFHWACRGCQITPLLADAYEAAYRLVEAC